VNLPYLRFLLRLATVRYLDNLAERHFRYSKKPWVWYEPPAHLRDALLQLESSIAAASISPESAVIVVEGASSTAGAATTCNGAPPKAASLVAASLSGSAPPNVAALESAVLAEVAGSSAAVTVQDATGQLDVKVGKKKKTHDRFVVAVSSLDAKTVQDVVAEFVHVRLLRISRYGPFDCAAGTYKTFLPKLLANALDGAPARQLAERRLNQSESDVRSPHVDVSMDVVLGERKSDKALVNAVSLADQSKYAGALGLLQSHLSLSPPARLIVSNVLYKGMRDRLRIAPDWLEGALQEHGLVEPELSQALMQIRQFAMSSKRGRQ
jgi:hypothetical protein